MLKRTVLSLGMLGLFLVKQTYAEKGYVYCDSRPDVPVYSAPGSLAASGTLACGQEVTVLGKENAYRKVVLPGGTTGYALSHFIREEVVSSQLEGAVPQPVSTQSDSRSSNKSGGSFWKKLAAGVAVGALITASAYATSADATYNPPSYQPAYQNTETAVVSPSLSTPRPRYHSAKSAPLSYSHSAASQRIAPLTPVTGSSLNFLGSEISVYGQDRNYLGKLGNKYDPDSINNPYGRYGSKYSPDRVNNPYGQYGSPYSPLSARNPYTTQAPILVDSSGQYLGRLSNNRYDPDSTGNRFGRYGSRFSPDSINNPFRAK